jgi:phosphoglycolate phosphatase
MHFHDNPDAGNPNGHLVGLDVDNFLIDSQKGLNEAMEEYCYIEGYSCDLKKTSTNYAALDRLDMGWGVPLDQQKAVMKGFSEFYEYEFVHNGRFLPEPYEGAQDVLEELSWKYELAAITARDRPTTHVIFKRHHIGRHFSTCRTECCAKEIGYKNKPSGEVIVYAMIERDYDLAHTVFGGDTDSDIMAANDAGVRSIAGTYGAHSRERLAAQNPTAYIDKITDLPKVLEEMIGPGTPSLRGNKCFSRHRRRLCNI